MVICPKCSHRLTSGVWGGGLCPGCGELIAGGFTYEHPDLPDATLQLIGLSGYAGSGKDLVASYIAARGFERVAFADTIRKTLYELNPMVGRTLRLRTIVDTYGWHDAKVYPDVRDLIQRMGDTLRDTFGERVLIDRTFRRLPSDRIVVSDVRLPIEARDIKERGGYLVRVFRPGKGPVNFHGSETALDAFEFDAQIVNDGTPGDLGPKVEELLGRWGLASERGLTAQNDSASTHNPAGVST